MCVYTSQPCPSAETPTLTSYHTYSRPEPPKITTSLADRIARLNATTQAQSTDRSHSAIHQPVGEIKSKISKYEATGQHEGPLIPKASFGLGAPLTKPDRGLDRIRIASLGVSGGTTLDLRPPSSSSPRSVSLGRPHSTKLSPNRSSQSSPVPPPSPSSQAQALASNPITSPDLDQETPQAPAANQHHQSPPRPNQSGFDSADAYDGILDGYPTTPAEEDSPPMVTCSDCLHPVELELLATHVCDLSLTPSNLTQPLEDPTQQLPDDVPVDAVESSQDPSPPSPTTSSCCSSSKRTDDVTTTTSSTTTTTTTTKTHLSPSGGPSQVPCSSITTSHEAAVGCGVGALSHQESSPQTTSPTHDDNNKGKEEAKNRLSDSSHSTNTSRLSSGNHPVRPLSSSAPRRSWYDDDDLDYLDSGEAPTGFVTIVRSSQRM
ncbi:uncharacterized protein VP01_1460g9 [Puccinia sorghi]|uniref:Uncharacterized protein n=1 Tax=Puccinia sorghi TaxID=27349 RepID=A0A0L6VJT2_9BASI|nr:uncharacterized protein VP01_1460g9 [Puccinia sorghi]